MDIIRIIKNIEEFIYEMALWLILIPKTLVRISFSPKWVIFYVRRELKKESSKQFQEYMSPILLWMLLVVIPSFIEFRTFASEMEMNDGLYKEFFGQSLESKILTTSFFLLAGPLSFAILMQRLKKKPFARENFKENFFVQIYSFIPMQFFFVISLLIGGNVMGEEVDEETFWSLFQLMIILFATMYQYYFFFYQYKILKYSVQLNWWKSILISIILFVLAIAMIVFMIFFFIDLYIPTEEELMGK